MKDAVKSIIAVFIGPVDLLGGLLDEDTSSRVRGALVAVLCILGGWFAKDYFGQRVTQRDLRDIKANQRVMMTLTAENSRRLCRSDTTNTAYQCQQNVQRRIRVLYDQALQGYTR